jgi:hypothetical protein
MTKTTNFEISKKLAEIKFNKETNFYYRKNDKELFINTPPDLKDPEEFFLKSYDLEILLNALPLKVGSYGFFLMGIRKENPLMPFAIGYNLGDDENYGMLYCDKMQDESLADVAGRLLIILHEKNLIKF